MYAEFIKNLVTKKRAMSFKDYDKLQNCSIIAIRSVVHKEEDPTTFIIPYTIQLLHFTKAFCDLGSSINLMPLTISNRLGLGDPKLTAMRQNYKEAQWCAPRYAGKNGHIYIFRGFFDTSL